jgi:hypothetical protein
MTIFMPKKSVQMNNKLLFAYKKKEREDFAFPLFFIIAIFYISFYFSSSFTNVPFRSVAFDALPLDALGLGPRFRGFFLASFLVSLGERVEGRTLPRLSRAGKLVEIGNVESFEGRVPLGEFGDGAVSEVTPERVNVREDHISFLIWEAFCVCFSQVDCFVHILNLLYFVPISKFFFVFSFFFFNGKRDEPKRPQE